MTLHIRAGFMKILSSHRRDICTFFKIERRDRGYWIIFMEKAQNRGDLLPFEGSGMTIPNDIDKDKVVGDGKSLLVAYSA